MGSRIISSLNQITLTKCRLKFIHLLLSVGFIEISRHYQDFLRDFRAQAQKSGQIEKSRLRRMIKSTNSRLGLRQTIKINQKFHVSMDFSISIETFATGRWCQDKIETSLSLRQAFWNLSNCYHSTSLAQSNSIKQGLLKYVSQPGDWNLGDRTGKCLMTSLALGTLRQ